MPSQALATRSIYTAELVSKTPMQHILLVPTGLIDEALSELANVERASGEDVRNLLLDLRILCSAISVELAKP